MAYPPMHRKPFQSEGAGPEIDEAVLPHDLEKKVTAPTAEKGDDSKQVATTAYVQAEIETIDEGEL